MGITQGFTRDEKGRRVVVLPLLVFILIVLLILTLVLVAWSVKRHRNVELSGTPEGRLQEMLPSIVALSAGTLEEGNSVELIQNGALWPRLFADIAAARSSVHIESFVWWTGEVCDQLAALLATKARQGVKVRVLLDASGSSKMDDRLVELMKEAGCELEKVHSFHIVNLGLWNYRDHRKIFVVDGKIGYVAGHGIADEWTGNAESKERYRDIAARIEGPLVNRLQGVFSENWIATTGRIFAGPEYFPQPEPAGNIAAHVAFSSPSVEASTIEILHYMAIEAAERTITIQNPYFLPDREGIEALKRAVRRGVDVRVMIPSASSTDNAIVQHASHHRFGALLDAGVKLWEYEKTLLHQKVMTIDGIWSIVGSTNFDDRSFELNDEISVGIVDPGIAAELERTFREDLRHARERRPGEWSQRGVWHKLIDALAFSVNEQL
jgi:cardiolipin synthase A/B